MKTEKRLGRFELGDDAYPLNYCIRNANEVSEALSEKTDESFGAYSGAARNIHILALLMRDGAEYVRRFHNENVQPPTEDELLCILTPADNQRVVAAIRETIEAGGMRLVEVDEKKGQAAPARETA